MTVMKGARNNFEFELEADDSRMKLFIVVRRTAAGNIVYDFLKEELDKLLPKAELDTAVLKDICEQLEDKDESERRRIAKGKAPEKGRDGKLVLLVKEFSPGAVPRPSSSSTVDFREVHLFDNLAAGQEIARLYPPKEGLSGLDVFGEEIPAEAGAECLVSTDESIEERQDSAKFYKSLYARSVGCLLRDSDSLRVSQELSIPGDLDYRYGSIYFVGSVTIAGNVLPGFKVQAKDGIQVQGDVDKSSLISSEGEVRIEGRLFGDEGSSIYSGKGFFAKSLLGVELEAHGNVEIGEEIRDSRVYASGFIEVSSGSIVGGETGTCYAVQASELGSEGEVETGFVALSEQEVSKAFRSLEAKHARYQQAREVAEAHLGPYCRNSSMVARLKPEFKKKIEALLARYMGLRKQEVAAKEELDKLRAREELAEQVVFSASDRMFSGCRFFRAGAPDFLVHESLEEPRSIVFKRKSSSFQLGDFTLMQAKEESDA